MTPLEPCRGPNTLKLPNTPKPTQNPPGTPRYRLWARQEFTFGAYVARHTMVVLLGLAYCCIAPLITVFCLLYFALVALAQKYQLVYVLSHPYEANGRMWLTVGGGRVCVVVGVCTRV
jgi:hypothetical protein